MKANLVSSIHFILIATLCFVQLCEPFTSAFHSQCGCLRLPSSSIQLSSLGQIQTITQTKQDVSMEQWHKRQGIICPNIEIRTTFESVGGRGLFWKQSKEHASQGQILAYVPHELIFEISNLRSKFPELNKLYDEVKNVVCDEENGDLSPSWPAVLTTYACEALLRTENSNNIWKEWIELWNGGGPEGPRPSRSYSEEEMSILTNMVNGDFDNIEEQVEEVLDKRYRTFVKDYNSVKKIVPHEETFASLYSIILSRTANLGPQWQNRRGVIPLHDMINHPPNDGSKTKNVELFCVGDVRNMVGDEMFKDLFSSLQSSTTHQNNNGSEGQNNILDTFSDKDILIVASKNIYHDDELLLSYRDCSKEVEIKTQIWLLLQYGFNFW